MGTKIFTDASTTLAEANLNKLISGDGTVGPNSKGFTAWGLYIYYSSGSSAWVASTTYGATEQTSNVVLGWSAVANALSIDISGCTNPPSVKYPLIFCQQGSGYAVQLNIKAIALSPTTFSVKFYDKADTLQTTEISSMAFNMLIFGAV